MYAQIKSLEAIVAASDLDRSDVRRMTGLLARVFLGRHAARVAARDTLRKMLQVDDSEIEVMSVDDWEQSTPEIASAAAELASQKEEFGRLLTSRIKVSGMTQSALAEKLGVSQSCISQFASGRHKPQKDTLERLAEALDCAVSDLWPFDP